MEAIAGLSIASNVIQVIGFAFQAVEICNQFYKHGTTVDIKSLEETSGELAGTTAELETSLSTGQISGPLTHSDAELSALSKKVCATADALNKELHALQLSPGSGRRAAFGKALKLKWRASRTEDARKRLVEYVQALDTKILVRLGM